LRRVFVRIRQTPPRAAYFFGRRGIKRHQHHSDSAPDPTPRSALWGIARTRRRFESRTFALSNHTPNRHRGRPTHRAAESGPLVADRLTTGARRRPPRPCFPATPPHQISRPHTSTRPTQRPTTSSAGRGLGCSPRIATEGHAAAARISSIAGLACGRREVLDFLTNPAGCTTTLDPRPTAGPQTSPEHLLPLRTWDCNPQRSRRLQSTPTPLHSNPSRVDRYYG